VVIIQALTDWLYYFIFVQGLLAKMNISAWYAWTIPLGAGVFAAMMLASAWKVISGRGVTWRGRKYHTNL